MFANFLLGTLGISAAARERLHRMPLDLIARHAVNDHGKLSLPEKRANEASMASCGVILSRYPIDPTDHAAGNVLIVTNESWAETTVYLESEE